MKILVDSIDTVNGKIFVLSGGRRRFLSDSNVKIECYEDSTEVRVAGSNKCKVKRCFYKLVVCGNVNLKFDSSHCYEVVCDYLRDNGVYKRLYLNNIVPIEVSDNEWIFSCDFIDF